MKDVSSITFETNLYLRPTSQGGREKPVVAYQAYSYRPHIILGGGISICGISLIEDSALMPGCSGKAKIMIVQPERIPMFNIGEKFLILEFDRIVGEGVVG
ncbi:hypothetical protein [Rhodanobacter ginsengiterrae]|uniref:hypothetical protein n=1 Tax=Rhodanobacter ginsengiterrae TaxID=2008451 RepID=UPI003CEF349F